MTKCFEEPTVPDVDLAARFAREAEPLIDALSRRAQRLTFNHADAEELLQDTLLDAYSGFQTFQPGTNFKAWMFRILHNRWCSAHRSRQRRPAEVLSGFVEHTAYASGTGRSAEAEAIDSFIYSDVHTAMGMLSPVIRDAIYFTIVAGYSYAETATMMGVPLGTVTSRVARGRRRLRTALTHAVPIDATTWQ
jgi:RNA polymerase sigma factor (sigma-70 family)